MGGAEEKAGSDCRTEEDSISSLLSGNGRQSIPSCGLKRSVSGITQISADPNGVAEYVSKKKGSFSQYKGIVPRPNGKWGVQIYEKNRRVWLGTFDTEEDAAQSYDTAALRFRGRKAITNFVPIDETHPEAIFLRRQSEAEIVNMLRTHTYHEELRHFYKTNAAETNLSSNKVPGSIPLEAEIAVFPRERLFDKTMTPSDVGKLNRLIIPKHHAQRCFPLDDAYAEKGVMLNFEDAAGKTWRFKYSYWNSSQSYVLTKGWRRYAKENHLQSGDIVTFERSTGVTRQLYISFRRQPCNLSLGASPVSALSYNQLNRIFYLPPSIEHRSIMFNAFIPCLIPVSPNFSPAYDFFSLYSSKKSEPDKRNSSPLDHQNLPRKILSSPSSAYPSRVMVFGVNLGLLSSSTSNVFPSATADKKRV